MNDFYLLSVLLFLIACSEQKRLPNSKGLAIPAMSSLTIAPKKGNLPHVAGTFPTDLGDILTRLVGKPISLVIDGQTHAGIVIFVKNNIVFLRGETSMGWFDWSKASGLTMSA